MRDKDMVVIIRSLALARISQLPGNKPFRKWDASHFLILFYLDEGRRDVAQKMFMLNLM